MAYLYLVKIQRGSSHSQWSRLFDNLSQFNPKLPDFTGHWGECVIKHHTDKETLHGMLTYKIRSKKSVTIEEITRDTLSQHHSFYQSMYDNYYAPHDNFPNIDDY